MLLVDRNDRPLALLTREDLLGEHASGYIDTEAAASDMIDWCGADILSKPEGIQRWAKHWRETRIVNGELLGECPSCGAMADACSPEGQFCEDEGCWEEGDDEG